MVSVCAGPCLCLEFATSIAGCSHARLATSSTSPPFAISDESIVAPSTGFLDHGQMIVVLGVTELI
jgi:hypothetical protein